MQSTKQFEAMETKAPFEKINAIKNWMDYVNIDILQKVKTVSDMEKLYDFCIDNDIWPDACERNESKQIKKLLGYAIH